MREAIQLGEHLKHVLLPDILRVIEFDVEDAARKRVISRSKVDR